MKKLLTFCFLLSFPILGETLEVSVKKCCPDGEALDDKTNDCTAHSGATFGQVVELTGIDLNKSVHDPGRTVPINVTFVGTGKPELSDMFERHVFKTGKDMTRYGEICINTCGQHEGTEYFWCKTKNSWDYCSMDHKHTIYNQPCHSNCAKERTSYYWCSKKLTEEQVDTCTKETSVWDYCSPGKESETWLTVEGKLVTSRYEKEFDHGDFCVDKDNSDGGKIMALMRDPCKGIGKGSKQCLNLCCPHGHVQIDRECVEHNETIDWNPEYWNGPDIMEAQERNTDYILSAPTKLSNKFTCPDKQTPVDTEIDLAEWKLHINGTLTGDFSTTNTTDIEEYQINEFCLVYGEPFLDYDDDREELLRDELEQNYMKCQKEEEKVTATKVTRALYPVAIGISTVFLFGVLVVMYLEPTLRTGLFGRITVGFVANVFIAYITISFAYGNIFEYESNSCVAAGYITQYTFLAFFFWLNAMAINICLKFSTALQFGQSAQDEGKTFWFYFGYAQGGPLVICLITAMVDHFGYKSACKDGEYADGSTALLPNMGVYICFLSVGAGGESGTYFEQPEFLYFQLFIIIIQILNIACFSTTVYFLKKHWNETSLDLDKNKKQRRKNIFVVFKLFIIMGIPWIFEIISSLIQFNHGKEEWFQKYGFAIRVILDIPNLFTGFLIFLVLVCKRAVFENLRATLCRKP